MNNIFQEMYVDASNDSFSEIIEGKEEKEINTENLLNTKITYKSVSMDIETILNILKRGDYVLPKYQRKYVWNSQQATNLIVSLIKNIPIPPIYLYYHDSDGKYVILDGQQRITTLFMYYRNIFYKNVQERKRLDFEDISRKLDRAEFINEKLKNNSDILSKDEQKQYENEIDKIYKQIYKDYKMEKGEFVTNSQDITFSKFNDKEKRYLFRKDLQVVFVQCDDENPQKVYTEIFKLLNSAGKELSTQEIRNGVYSENYLYEMIDEFNESNAIWRNIYGNSLVSKDFEYLLRFLALDYYTEYDKNKCIVKISIKNKFTLANMIDNYSELFNKKYPLKSAKNELQQKFDFGSSVDETNVQNENINKMAKNEVKKLSEFFEKFNDVLDNKVSGGKILILEAIFVAFSKLGLFDKDVEVSYFNLIDSLDLTTDFGIGSSSSNKGNVEKRINKAIEIVKEHYSKWI